MARRPCFLTCASHGILSRMNKSDLKEIKDIVDSALGTHFASVHEEITDLRRDMDAEFAEVDAEVHGSRRSDGSARSQDRPR